MSVNLKDVQCLKCGWAWTPKVKKPAACPNCKRYDWDRQKKGGDK